MRVFVSMVELATRFTVTTPITVFVKVAMKVTVVR